MHEYAITENILKTVIEEAEKAHAGKVLEIRLVIGELSAFEEESIKMYFDILCEGTVAKGAKIVARNVRAVFHCPKCGDNYPLSHLDYDCPKCGETGVFDDTGKECLIESIVIE